MGIYEINRKVLNFLKGFTMLKTVKLSQANKTAGLAVTYRAGKANKYDTCPASCELNASGRGCAPSEIDAEYLDAVLDSKPRGGHGFTYSHFSPLFWAHKLSPVKTVINFSAASIKAAAANIRAGIPAVVVVATDFWKKNGNAKNTTADGVRGLRCPAEYLDGVGCINCGGEKAPLCARLDRDFFVMFTAHGAGKKKAGNPDAAGGCYADGGRVAIHWNDTSNAADDGKTDGEKLRAFVKTLPPRSIIRHHVAGDIGKE